MQKQSDCHFVVCHKHPISGRLHFLRFASGDICGIEPLPKLAVMTDCNSRAVEMHSAAELRKLTGYLDLPEHRLSVFGDFKLYLEVPHQFARDGLLPIYLAAVAGYELPVLPEGSGWIELPDSFALPNNHVKNGQREILQKVHEYLMG